MFYGREPDFYKDYEMGTFSQYPSEGYAVEINPKATANKLTVGFSTFESQKENEKANTEDEVHGNATDLLVTRTGSAAKEVKIGFVFSAFSIEAARVKAFDLNDTVATQDDNKKYFLKCLPLAANSPKRNRQETANLQHTGNGSNILTLTNEGTFSWVIIGIEAGDTFSITAGS